MVGMPLSHSSGEIGMIEKMGSEVRLVSVDLMDLEKLPSAQFMGEGRT